MAQLDANLILGYKPIEIPDQPNQLLKAMQLKQAMQQGQLGQMQIEGEQNKLMQAAGLESLYRGLPAGATAQQTAAALRSGGYGAQALAHEDKAAGIAQNTAQTAGYNVDVEAKKLQAQSALAQALSQKPDINDGDIAKFQEISLRSGWDTPETFRMKFGDIPANQAERAAYMGMSAQRAISAADQIKQKVEQQKMGLTMRGQDVTMRGQDLTNARAGERNTITAGMGKSPPGYRTTPDGNLQAIPGGPADLKMQGALNQDTASLSGSVSSMDRLATAANEALNHPGLASTAGWRGVIPNVPGTDAANAAALLGTLKSQVAFGVLQDMRNNSKTGGALGAVSDAEGKRLESNLAALDKSQSIEQLKESLQKIVDYTQGAKDRLRGAYNMKHGDTQQPGVNTAPAGMSQVRPAATSGAPGKQIKRIGIQDGRKVVEYVDGSVAWQ